MTVCVRLNKTYNGILGLLSYECGFDIAYIVQNCLLMYLIVSPSDCFCSAFRKPHKCFLLHVRVAMFLMTNGRIFTFLLHKKHQFFIKTRVGIHSIQTVERIHCCANRGVCCLLCTEPDRLQLLNAE